MAPAAPIVVALFSLANSSPDEQSMLQMPMMDKNIESDASDSDCACPAYFEADCLANAFQGCIWEAAHGSNAPWCACDPNFVPTLPLYTDPDTPVPEPPADAEGDLRLVDSRGDRPANSGRLDIYHNGEWGTILENFGRGLDEANVACHQLGFPFGADSFYVHGGAPGAFPGRIWLDGFGCWGDEDRVDQCSKYGPLDWGEYSGTSLTSVGLVCNVEAPAVTDTDASEGDLRIAAGSRSHGRLEIFHEGQWGTICSDDFEQQEADTACRQLGFPAGAIRAIPEYGGGAVSTPIWLNEVDCTPEATRIDQCDHAAGDHSILGSGVCLSHEAVGVECSI